MRIINQDKTCDIPYEKSVLNIQKVNEDSFNVNGYFSDRYFWLGSYKDMNHAKAVLWAIASNFREDKKYFEMPQAYEDLTCIQ